MGPNHHNEAHTCHDRASRHNPAPSSLGHHGDTRSLGLYGHNLSRNSVADQEERGPLIRPVSSLLHDVLLDKSSVRSVEGFSSLPYVLLVPEELINWLP